MTDRVQRTCTVESGTSSWPAQTSLPTKLIEQTERGCRCTPLPNIYNSWARGCCGFAEGCGVRHSLRSPFRPHSLLSLFARKWWISAASSGVQVGQGYVAAFVVNSLWIGGILRGALPISCFCASVCRVAVLYCHLPYVPAQIVDP